MCLKTILIVKLDHYKLNMWDWSCNLAAIFFFKKMSNLEIMDSLFQIIALNQEISMNLDQRCQVR